MLAIADWAEDYNRMDIHLILEIPSFLLEPSSSSLQARVQFPLAPAMEEPGVTDVWTRSQAMWIFLCAILQYFEDDMAAREGALYSAKTRWPSALVIYIMAHVNPGLLEHYRVHWHNIVGKTPWLATQNHLSQDEFCHFYMEPGLDIPSEMELATEYIYCRSVKGCSSERVGWSIPPSITC